MFSKSFRTTLVVIEYKKRATYQQATPDTYIYEQVEFLGC